MNENDLALTYSGGMDNSDPNASLGGQASIFMINEIVFDNLSNAEIQEGGEDYRCFYIINNAAVNISNIEEDTLLEPKIFLEALSDNISNIEFGFYEKNDEQSVTIFSENEITSGSINFEHDGYDFTVNFSPDLETFKNNFYNSFISATPISDLNINLEKYSNYYIFFIQFINADGHRYQPLLTYSSIDLDVDASIVVRKLKNGGPINTIATKISFENQRPSDVTFYKYNRVIQIGNLRASEGLPIWIKRKYNKRSLTVADDGFKLRITGKVALR
jgi:hypothetical protein